MTLQTRRVLITLAFAFVIGGFASSFMAWLLVPARLSVEYLTPITVSGPFAGLLVGAVLARFGLTMPQPLP